MLGNCLTSTFYSWDGCRFISNEDVIFQVTVVDEYTNEKISKVQKKKLDPLNEILLNLTVDCTSNDVRANWDLTSYPYNGNEYCLEYKCSGLMKKEMVCYTYFVYSCSYSLLSVRLCLVQHYPYHTWCSH